MCECSFVSKENLFGVWDIKGMGGIKTCIPAMLGQVGKGSLEIKLLQMCYPEPCECSVVPKANLVGVWELNGMGGVKKSIQAMLGQV